MKKQPFELRSIEPWPGVSLELWRDWKWQLKNSLKTAGDFAKILALSPEELEAFSEGKQLFRSQSTPYYASLIQAEAKTSCPIRKMIVPSSAELQSNVQEMLDPLGENKKTNRACERLIHRYTDRALFLVTDMCGVYCRYCTRKHFTASDQVVASKQQLEEVVTYLQANPQIKEVIFSGGDPLTLSNNKLSYFLEKIYSVESVELIRIGSRMPVASPMRIDDGLISLFKEFKPIYMMTHFNHPEELTVQAAEALEKLVDNGVPVFNQLVLLNGINNDPALIYALSRRLLYFRVKPYYMFQADPSLGTDHLRTSIDESLEIQKQLWGHASGLAMSNYIVDIPDGGGKAALSPNYQTLHQGDKRSFKGWDQVEADYLSPQRSLSIKPHVSAEYQQEWLSRP